MGGVAKPWGTFLDDVFGFAMEVLTTGGYLRVSCDTLFQVTPRRALTSAASSFSDLAHIGLAALCIDPCKM